MIVFVYATDATKTMKNKRDLSRLKGLSESIAF